MHLLYLSVRYNSDILLWGLKKQLRYTAVLPV